MKQIIAIVVTYKRKELLKKVLYSLIQQSVPLQKIIIIDNNSSDGTYELCKKLQYEFSNIEYYNTGANLGGAGGFRFGFEKAKRYNFDYIWLMDDDLLPHQECLEGLLENASFDIIQPLRSNLDGTCAELSPIKFDLEEFLSISPKKQTVKEYIDKNSFTDKSALEIDGVPFEGPLISRTVVDKVGLPESKFFIFYDDMDYSIRSKLNGFRIGCAINAKATRLLMNNQKSDLSSWKGYFMLRNLFYLFFTYGLKSSTRFKPYVLACGFITLSLFKGDFKSARVCWDAICDAKKLNLNKKYIP